MIAALHLFTQIVKERTAPDVGSPGFAPGGGVVESLHRLCSAYTTIFVGETLRHLLLLHNRTEATELEPGWGRKGRGARLARVLLRATSVSLLLGGANSVLLQLFLSPEETFPGFAFPNKQ